MRQRILIGVTSALLVASGLIVPGAADAAGTWHVTDHIGTSSTVAGSQYAAIDSSSAAGTWAVGDELLNNASSAPDRPLVAHWNGTKWVHLSGPPAPANTHGAELTAVRAYGPHNIWVAGFALFGSSLDNGAFVARWNGSSWYVHSFGSGSVARHLAVFATNDVWVLGEDAFYTSTPRTAAWHYNGSGWTRSGLPARPSDLSGATASGLAPTGGPAARTSGLLHYVGGKWTLMSTPHISLPTGALSYWFNDAVWGPKGSIWLTVAYGGNQALAPGLGLWFHDASGWQHRLQLANTSPIGAATDTRSGIWLLTGGTTPHAYLVHYTGQTTVHTVQPPSLNGVKLDMAAITRQPGTFAVQGAGAFNTSTASTAGIASYAP